MTPTEPMLINCGPHGECVSAVVCGHLLQHYLAPVGFVENNDDPNDLQAWCYLCEDKFQSEGDMTDAFREFNGMTIVCVICYAESKGRHTIPAIQ
ncbi:hypothetical protein [Xanthomonas citri]|uniref:Uncharacterized protein n=2 Tax=Xanthomonas citri TaxID=346 RepID=A0AB33CJ05_XANCI|nr:hypothetical protein [Xanthomonas citri]ASK91935.1 hypothetical protein XcvCFBP7111P_10840 [Xanthomonas citri pv. vignicola]MBZ3923403.1 hypothetical protein [Xanthomonas citri pv. sesbaniae]